MKELLNKCRLNEQKTQKENNESSISYILNEKIINFFDEKKEKELDCINVQGAIDLKIFIIERYYYIFNYDKVNKETQNNFFKLIRKYLKNETEDIGTNKYFLSILNPEKISDRYFKILNELLIYFNENLKRIKEIWEINLNSKPEKNKIKNSIEFLLISINFVSKYYYKYRSENKPGSFNIDNEFKLQENLFNNKIKDVIHFIKQMEKEKIDNNYKINVLENFLIFFYQIFKLFLQIKLIGKSQITKEQTETICQGCFFIIKNGTQNNLIDLAFKLLDQLIDFSKYIIEHDVSKKNNFYNELFNSWKIYFNYEKYLENKYCTKYKINSVFNYLIKFYGKCFRINENNKEILFVNILKCMENDGYIAVKKLIEKMNDFNLSFENKVNTIKKLIYYFLECEKDKLSFNDLCFVMKQLLSFFQILYFLNKNERFIGIFMKEEKKIQKNNYQKDMLKVCIDNIEENKIIIQRNNLNGIFYYLTKNKYDKYIYEKDYKYLYEILNFMQTPLNDENPNSDFISKLISYFKKVLINPENSSDPKQKSYMIDKIADLFSKFFFYYFYIYEKIKTNHQFHEANEPNRILSIYIREFIGDNLNKELFISVFTKLMPYIFKLYKYGLEICPSKNCISSKLIHNIFKNIKNEKSKEKVFKIYFEYFTLKINEIGNPKEIFNNELNNYSDECINNITILKSIIFNLLECITDLNYYKDSLIPLIIDIIYLSKNSECYGNYIYILRCLFKYLKTGITSITLIPTQDIAIQNKKKEKNKLINDFNFEINYILYAIVKYLNNLKQRIPFFSDTITEMISVLPIKNKYLIDIPNLIFPSLIDNLFTENDKEIIKINILNIERWMNLYNKNPENVIPTIKNNLSKFLDILSNSSTSSLKDSSIYFNIYKWLSRFGGRNLNYFKEKKVIAKTSPMQIISMKLKDKKENRSFDFVLDYIIDICIDNFIEFGGKIIEKKIIANEEKKLISNHIEIFKNCLAVFFQKKIDYNYILEIKQNIINGINNFNEQEFNSEFSFRQMNDKNSKIKINNLFRKKDHFILGKIITGYFLIKSVYLQNPNYKKEIHNIENDLMKFFGDYFIMILLSKEKNNKNILLFEQNPILFLDEIIQFLFSNYPSIMKNTNIQLTEYSLEIINNIIDSIKNFFDNDIKIIKDLEIIDIIYLKFMSNCYIKETNKIDLGLILIKVLLQKFDKYINFKYLKYFFKCISSVSSNYPNIVNIQFKKGCNNLVEVIEYLINMFIINDSNYDLLTENDFDNENKLIFEKENEKVINIAKNNFIMQFEFLKYCFDEIVEKIDSENNYIRNIGIYFVNKIIGKNPRLKSLIPLLLQLDISNFTIKEFIQYYKKNKNSIDYYSILNGINNNNINIMEKEIYINKDYKNKILPNFTEKKIYNKLNNIFNTLTKKLGLRESSFTYLISSSEALNNIYDISPCLIEEFIFSLNNVDLLLEVIKSLYLNILISYFNYCQISIYLSKNLSDPEENLKLRYIYLFMEQLLVEKNLEYEYIIYDETKQKLILKNEIPNEYIKYIEKYIKDNNVFRNEVNISEYIVAEIFENLGLRINMVVNYIKLLTNIFSEHRSYFVKEKMKENVLNIFYEYKKKTTQLIFLQILNLRTSSILKQCSKYMCEIFKYDEKLKKEIFHENQDKILNLIDNINLEEIKNSNCVDNHSIKLNKLDNGNMISLMIISKSIGLDELMKNKLILCLKHYENISEEKFENSQILLFYGYISIFLYIDISDHKDFIYRIFEQILSRIKENILFPSKSLLNFTKIVYGDKVFKLISKYSKFFSQYIIENSENIIKNKYIINLIKTIINYRNNNIFCENIIKEITNEFKKEILRKNNIDDYKNNNKLIKVTQLLKICRIISKHFPIYLKSSSILNIFEEQIKNLIIYYDNNFESCINDLQYLKIFKNWIKLHMIYIKSFKDKEFSLNSLFFFISLKNISYVEKNRIELLLLYQINILNGNNNEKNYKYIMNSFMTLNEDIQKYFDLYVDKLIIPLIINFYKERNFFTCYNKENLKSDKKVNILVNKKIDYDEEYLLEILEKLTLGLYKIKFIEEKKEEKKYQLLILLIVLYKEYLNQKNFDNNYNEKTKNIYYNIQALLSYSPLYENEKDLGYWRIYLFFGICLFNDKIKIEGQKNLQIIFNFCKKLNEENLDAQNLIYELIISNCTKDETFYSLFKYSTTESPNNGIFFLNIILKYPNIFYNLKEYIIKDLLLITYELIASKNFFNHKKTFLQTIGLFTSYISKARNNLLNNQIINIKSLEEANFHIGFRFYRYSIQCLNGDPEIFDMMKKLLNYFREINSIDLNINFEFKFEKFPKLLHIHIYFLRIIFFNFGYNNLFMNKNIEHYFIINKYMIENNINHRIFNDFMLIFRLFTDPDVLFKLNKHEKIKEYLHLIEYKRNLMNKFSEIIKDKNNMKNKFTNYDIKVVFTSYTKINDNYKNIIDNVKKYLIEKNYYPNPNANLNQQIISNNQNQSLISTEAENPNIPQNQQVINIPQIPLEKWLETFNIYEFKNFIFYYKFIIQFYTQLPSMIQILNDNNKNNNNNEKLVNITELKIDLENKFKMMQETIDLLDDYTFSFFENFYFFTLFFLQEYLKLKDLISKDYCNSILCKEIKEYFNSSHNYFYNLRNYDDLKKIKEEEIELLKNDKNGERGQNNNKRKYLYYMECIYPDIILSTFLFFIQCDKIMKKYYIILLELFLHIYRYFRNKFYDPLLEYIIKEIMNNKILENKPEDKNIFMLKFLQCFDMFKPYKIYRPPKNMINIFINYLEYYITKTNFNKKDINIIKSLRIILYICSIFDLENRKHVYEIIKCFIGDKLIDGLKWIFTFDENESYSYYFIYYETIPLSIDFFLSYFEDSIPLIVNDNNFSKFKNLNKFNNINNNENFMQIEEALNENDANKLDKNNFIKNMVDNCNDITKEKKVSDLLDPIRSIITSENNIYYKLFSTIFIQIWKMLSKSEQEILNLYINDFLYKQTSKIKDVNNNMNINLLLSTFFQCSPMIYIKPTIIQVFIPYYNICSTITLYLENLLINGIDIANSYNSLINIFNSIKEDELCNGLKYYFTENNNTKEGYVELQSGNYLKAENIFYECFNKLNEDILNKIDNININEFNLDNDNFELFNELSLWEDGLIECYEKNDKWNNIIEISDINNNKDLKINGIWNYSNDKLKDFDKFIKNDISQNIKCERSLGMLNSNNSFIFHLNEICSIFKQIKENIQPNQNNTIYIYIFKCIQNLFQSTSLLYSKNLENIAYHHFLILQSRIESSECNKILTEILEKSRENINNITQLNYKDTLLFWRERLPHYCEGYTILENVLESRNYLFKIFQSLINNNVNENIKYLPNYSDKVWNDMIYMKYARKLGLIETFYKKKNLFEEENKDMIKMYPYEIYLKEIECIKFIRNNTYNYNLGVNVCDEAINKYLSIIQENNKNLIEYICNDLKRHKAYFYYKQGNIIDAHNLFIEASIFKNKECTDYHLYSDWSEMCEEITKLTINTEEYNEWFDNTLYNYIYTIIYKLDKAKFVIPKMIDFIKEFEKVKLKNKFNNELDEIPSWIWIFWLPVLFENLNYYKNNDEKNDFFFYILKKIAIKYQQMFYYPYKIYSGKIKEKNISDLDLDINKKYEELYNIISSENKYSHFIDKIELIITELTKKEENNRINSLNSILNLIESKSFKMDNINNLKEFLKQVATYLDSFPDLKYFSRDIINLLDNPDITRNQIRGFIIKNKYYIHNLILLESEYKKNSNLMINKLYNTDFSNIELPGYFSNKIIEPNEQNLIYISKFESEYNFKYNSDARTIIFIKGNNDKLISFIVENQDANNNFNNKINVLKILFNFIFQKNYETYKRKIKFNTPIKYFVSSKIKIIEEEINLKYNMEEIYEYCLQKRGYDPYIAYQIFEEEGEKNKLDSNYLYYSKINNENVFKRMCKIIPQDSFKNFIHKFILNCEDILLFRKQFTVSYAINNLMNFIISDNTILKNISFNKETGLCIFNTDLKEFPFNNYKELEEQKSGTPIRLTKNINNFLSISSIYGIIPGVFYFSCKALINKQKILKTILKLCLGNNIDIYKQVEIHANNYINKLKYVINIEDDPEYFQNKTIRNNLLDNSDDDNIMSDKEIKGDNTDGNMKNIFEIIENSMNDDKLMRKSVDYEAWF